ncbi:NVEALA domain-containing protein [Parabacteroides sp. AF14-59]|uniref:NVEALA domain-containing protein n=1 Tax=Parabacteroides sp. AF14-59 TaxID=2292240 RepID=UPI000F00EC30|nr:NVEALA domain-containing protein [Parabacteroides sp. AF14-59]RHR91211.1 hypothetical protein DWW23_26165 [Parabacteroides sp. AF14-59]
MKKLFGIIAIAAIAATAGWNFCQSQDDMELSDLALANVEALARGESGCPNGCVENGDGCFCNMWHPVYAEYKK